MPRLCLIDAHSLCYRAFFAIKVDLRTSYGQPTNAIYGFVNMLNRILEELKPEYIAICFDVAKPTFREQKFKEYKIQRLPMPDSLKSQLPLIRDIISAYNITMLEQEGFEADDIIATLASRATKQGIDVVIVTSDKDLLQLVNDRIHVYNPYKGDGLLFDEKTVEETFGVKPANIIDLLSLMGDSVDNIPGVKGIGEKTARNLLSEFKDTETLLRKSEAIKSEKLRDLIQENKEMILLSRDLALLPRDLAIDCEVRDLSFKQADWQRLYELFSRFEFKSFLKALSGKVTVGAAAKTIDFLKDIQDSSDCQSLRKEIAKTGVVALSLAAKDSLTELLFYAGGARCYRVSSRADLKAILADQESIKIGENIKQLKWKFDEESIELQGKLFDIAIAAYLCDPARANYTLGALLYDFCKIGPLLAADEENRRPVIIFHLYQLLQKELRDKKLDELFFGLEMPLVDVLFTMEKNGIHLDCDLLNDISKKLSRKLDTLMKNIYSLAGQEFNINSPKQLREILFTKLNLPVVKKTKTGPSTDEEVLRKLAPRHEIVSLILEYRQITKLQSTYLDVLPQLCDKKTKRIHTTFLQAGTETGRLSSINPNLQNIPVKTELGRQIRQAFIAHSAQWLLMSSDYSQVELRILAHLSGDETLSAAFKSNADIHKITASLIYSVDINDVQDSMRENAKRVNFGIIYGISAYGLSKDLEIGVDVAQDFIDTYFARYPKVKQHIDSQIEAARKNGYVMTIMGRRRYLPYINSTNMNLRQFSERQAINAPIQGSAADLIKVAMIGIHNEIKKAKLEAKMVLQVHDELVFDFPAAEKSQLIQIVRENMEAAIKLDVPLQATLKIGKNWLDMESVDSHG